MPKALTVRLDDEPAHELHMVARIDGLTVAEVVRVAIAAHVQRRRKDPRFSERRGYLIKALGPQPLSAPSPTLPATPSPPQEGPVDAQP